MMWVNASEEPQAQTKKHLRSMEVPRQVRSKTGRASGQCPVAPTHACEGQRPSTPSGPSTVDYLGQDNRSCKRCLAAREARSPKHTTVRLTGSNAPSLLRLHLVNVLATLRIRSMASLRCPLESTTSVRAAKPAATPAASNKTCSPPASFKDLAAAFTRSWGEVEVAAGERSAPTAVPSSFS